MAGKMKSASYSTSHLGAGAKKKKKTVSVKRSYSTPGGTMSKKMSGSGRKRSMGKY